MIELKEELKNKLADFLYEKKIIEFQGDIYHGNPKLFNENDKPNPFKKNLTCKELWIDDENRKKYLESLGYSVLVIWENDYKKNSDLVIQRCKTWILN